MSAEELAKAIFNYFNTNSVDIQNRPYFFNEDAKTLRISIDGEVDCLDLAKTILTTSNTKSSSLQDAWDRIKSIDPSASATGPRIINS